MRAALLVCLGLVPFACVADESGTGAAGATKGGSGPSSTTAQSDAGTGGASTSGSTSEPTAGGTTGSTTALTTGGAASGVTEGETGGLKLDVGADPDGLPPGCVPGSEWIYLLTNTYPAKLLRFHPDTLAVDVVGDAACTDQGNPYALAVDRSATIWAHWVGPEQLFRVDSSDASCSPSTYDPAATTFDFFGIGFAAPPGDATAEVLYVAGGTFMQGLGNGTNLGVLDLETMLIAELPALPGGFPPALTGNAAGELWGLFVGGGQDLQLLELDPVDASVLQTLDLPGLSAQNYALGFWGGLFYVFADATVYAVDPRIGVPEEVVADLGFPIVGAGQSTCVPLLPPG